jgi:hypothetical protein
MSTVPTQVSIKSGKLIRQGRAVNAADAVLHKDTIVKDKDLVSSRRLILNATGAIATAMGILSRY